MAILVILVSVDASARLKPIARTTNLELARHVIVTLRDNRLCEDDEADVIYDSDFLVEAERMIARLTSQMRQSAAASLLDVDDADVDGGGPTRPRAH